MPMAANCFRIQSNSGWHALAVQNVCAGRGQTTLGVGCYITHGWWTNERAAVLAADRVDDRDRERLPRSEIQPGRPAEVQERASTEAHHRLAAEGVGNVLRLGGELALLGVVFTLGLVGPAADVGAGVLGDRAGIVGVEPQDEAVANRGGEGRGRDEKHGRRQRN